MTSVESECDGKRHGRSYSFWGMTAGPIGSRILLCLCLEWAEAVPMGSAGANPAPCLLRWMKSFAEMRDDNINLMW
jgi:hypothetical protein